MVELLQCNCITFAEFHIARSLRMYIKLCGRLVTSHKRMQNVNKDGWEKMMLG
jgi:hypothetical protein